MSYRTVGSPQILYGHVLLLPYCFDFHWKLCILFSGSSNVKNVGKWYVQRLCGIDYAIWITQPISYTAKIACPTKCNGSIACPLKIWCIYIHKRSIHSRLRITSRFIQADQIQFDYFCWVDRFTTWAKDWIVSSEGITTQTLSQLIHCKYPKSKFGDPLSWKSLGKNILNYMYV